MKKVERYKKQGDGRDSWEIKIYDDNGNLVDAYMVYDKKSRYSRFKLWLKKTFGFIKKV